MDPREFRTFRGYQIQEQEKDAALTPSMEDYLEMIYRCSEDDGVVRVNQLAEQLNVQASSVSRVLRKLAVLGYIRHSRYGFIQLTDKGLARGKYLLNRHKVVESLLKALGVSNAFRDAEMIEHHIVGETLAIFALWLGFLMENPEVLARFAAYRTSQRADGLIDGEEGTQHGSRSGDG